MKFQNLDIQNMNLSHTVCLVFPPDPASSRIVGGEDAAEGVAPFQCSLQMFRSHFCGCSIISEKWILTASHCLAGRTTRTLEVRVGTNDLRSGGKYYKTDKIIMHKGYNKPRFGR